MSEIITPEVNTEEFTPLLFEMRSLLFSVRQNDIVDHFTVTEHTDTRSVLSAGNPRQSIVHFVIEDTPKGVLARSLQSQVTPDGMVTLDNTILLSTPGTSRMLSATRNSMSKTMFKPAHDSNIILDQMDKESAPLSDDAIVQWYAEVHELWQHKPDHRPEVKKPQPPQNTPPFSRLFKRHVSRV